MADIGRSVLALDQGIRALQAGSLVAVIGPSGSGKTTLLDGFCGLLREEQSHWQIEELDEPTAFLDAESAPLAAEGIELVALQLGQIHDRAHGDDAI